MNDNSRDVMMSVEKAQQLAQRFILAPALYTTIVIVQFVARMHKANLIKKTDWESFDKFTKMCDYKFEVADIPLSQDEIEQIKSEVSDKLSLTENLQGRKFTEEMRVERAKEMIKSGIKDKLDEMGVHYCMLSDDFDPEHIKIYYAKNDKQRFDNFLGSYIKDHLVSGEMSKDELKKIMNDKVSIISVPDALEEKLQEAMKVVDVTFAKIEDLNLADGKKQMYIPNHQLQTVSQLYQEIRNGLISQGMEDPGPMQEMTQEELNATAVCQNEQEFVDRCDEEHKKTSESFINEDSKSWEEISNRYEPLGTKDSIEYLQNPNYFEISIDDNTLVSGSDADRFTQGVENQAYFCCRIPAVGKYNQENRLSTGKNDNAKFLLIPKEQVFIDKNCDKKRYVAFLESDKNHIILNYEGKQEMNSPFCNPSQLKIQFDPQNSKNRMTSAGENLSIQERNKFQQSTSTKPNKFHNFHQREYSEEFYETLEKELR